MNEAFDKMYKLRHVLHDNLSCTSAFPIYSETGLTMNTFTTILQKKYPPVLNWDTNLVQMAMNMNATNENISLGMSQDMVTHDLPDEFLHTSTNNDMIQDEMSYRVQDPTIEDRPLYHHFTTYIKDISSYVNDHDKDMKAYLDQKLCTLVRESMQYQMGTFVPPSEGVDFLNNSNASRTSNTFQSVTEEYVTSIQEMNIASGDSHAHDVSSTR